MIIGVLILLSTDLFMGYLSWNGILKKYIGITIIHIHYEAKISRICLVNQLKHVLKIALVDSGILVLLLSGCQ